MAASIEKLADNAYLKLVERVAVPAIVAIVGAQWWSIDAINKKMPEMQYRIERLEEGQKAITARADIARKERLDNQQAIIERMARFEERQGAIKEAVQKLADELARGRGGARQ